MSKHSPIEVASKVFVLVIGFVVFTLVGGIIGLGHLYTQRGEEIQRGRDIQAQQTRATEANAVEARRAAQAAEEEAASLRKLAESNRMLLTKLEENITQSPERLRKAIAILTAENQRLFAEHEARVAAAHEKVNTELRALVQQQHADSEALMQRLLAAEQESLEVLRKLEECKARRVGREVC